MSYLYLLAEDDTDELFFQGCLSRITGNPYEVIFNKLRKGGGLSEVRRKLPLLLQSIKNTGPVEDTFFLVVVDNDRSPIHPEHVLRSDFSKLPKKDKEKTCRYCEIEKVIASELGNTSWPIRGAISIPVEMMETWQLLICDPKKYQHEQSSIMPIFSKRRQSSAKHYYASSNVPAQLKDLVAEIGKSDINIESSQQFCEYCVEKLDVDDLKSRSPSFTQFANQVQNW